MFIVLLFNNSANCQSRNNNTLAYSVGVGMSDGNHSIGGGPMISIGYQHNLWKDKLRLSPNLAIGFFNAGMVTDVPDQYFNSVSLETNLYFDALRFKAFSITLGAGGVLNRTNGLIGSGGENPANQHSDYFSSWQYGVYFGGGFRIVPTKGRIIYTLLPLNFHVGPDYFMEGFARLGIEVKL